MKNLFTALTLCITLILFGSLVITRSIEAQTQDALQLLLEIPAPPPPNPLVPVSGRVRSEAFYSRKNPPADDAPIEDLLDYWQFQNRRYRSLGYNPKLSGRSLERILGEIEKDPDKAVDFLNVLPAAEKTGELIKRIYEQKSAKEDENEEDYRLNRLRTWLKYHTPYFSDELLTGAEMVGDTEAGYVTNQEDLLALARIDFRKAKPILDRLYADASQPVSQTLARWAFYRHALDTDSFGDIERYREELMRDVENKNAPDGLRDLALDALVKEKEWSGRDEWYFSLLEDETLADLRVGGTSFTGLTTLLLFSPPEKYADKMIELLESPNPAVRNAAARNLASLLPERDPKIIRALLPWLENAAWAREYGSERRTLVGVLADVEMPESVPGLIALLDEKSTREVAYSGPVANTAPPLKTNSNSVVTVKTKTVEYFPFRSEAVTALARQKDARAVPALRRILPQTDRYERPSVIRAIYLSNGFSIAEQMAALETAARSVKDDLAAEELLRKAAMNEKAVEKSDETFDFSVTDVAVASTTDVSVKPYDEEQPSPPLTAAEIQAVLAQQIVANPEPPRELLTAVVGRINVLEKTDPMLAAALRRIVLGWKGEAVNAVLLNDLKKGKADINAVVKLLSIRKELREKQINDIYALRAGDAVPFARGVSACLLGAENDYNTLLIGDDAEAKAAMLGCARLIRAALPVELVAQNLSSTNKLLALAAERYLEAEDGPQARQIILSKYPGQARILGATTFFGERADLLDESILRELFRSIDGLPPFEHYYLFYGDKKKIFETEKKLQKEILSDPELIGVYAYDDNFVRIYRDRVMFSFAEDEARYRERYLTETEFNNLKNYLAASRVDELKPFLEDCEDDCEEKELLMLGRAGGRRIYLKGDGKSAFFNGLDRLFEDMRQAPARLRYELEKTLPGLEILFADERLTAETVWKNGADLRVLISDKALRERIDGELQKQEEAVTYDENTDYEEVLRAAGRRRRERAFEHLSWQRLAGENAREPVGPPPGFDLPPAPDALGVKPSSEQWKARAAGLEIRADATGLYKISGGNVKKISDGYYLKAVVTPDGRWAVAAKLEPRSGFVLTRVNLANDREFVVELKTYSRPDPAVALPAGKKVLFRLIPFEEFHEDEETGPETVEITQPRGEIFALDVETGAVESVRGPVRPLVEQTFRPLQAASVPGQFWAAVAGPRNTEIGLYTPKTFTFKRVMTIPQISFSSMNMWVDEAEKKIYFVYKGQLLALKMELGVDRVNSPNSLPESFFDLLEMAKFVTADQGEPFVGRQVAEKRMLEAPAGTIDRFKKRPQLVKSLAAFFQFFERFGDRLFSGRPDHLRRFELDIGGSGEFLRKIFADKRRAVRPAGGRLRFF